MVVQQILHHLIKYPNAKDTIQGILHWWLPKDLVERSDKEVQEALDALVKRGWLTQRQTASSQRFYGLNEKKLEEIKVFLREQECK
jgi:hypothetical protein